MSALDNFLAAYFYASDLSEQAADKESHERADQLLREKESAFITEIKLDLDNDADSDKFDRILELADNYRKDEREYQTLVNYVNEISNRSY